MITLVGENLNVSLTSRMDLGVHPQMILTTLYNDDAKPQVSALPYSFMGNILIPTQTY